MLLLWANIDGSLVAAARTLDALDEKHESNKEAYYTSPEQAAVTRGSTVAPQWKSMEIHGFFNIFLDFWGIFGIFGQILRFLVKIRSESCRRLRDLQKSIVILSNGAIWTRNVSLLKKTLPP